MTFPKVGYILRPLATSSTIKNTVELQRADTLFPGYSASGQDVWLPYYDHDGPAIVLSAVGAQCGKTFLASGKWGTVANTTAFAIDEKKSSPAFLHYMTNQKDFWEKGGSAQPYVKVSETLRKRFFIPDLSTQREIADFLDRETARIDLLIEKKQKLVKLLGERKTNQLENLLFESGFELRKLRREAQIISKGTTPSTIGADMVDEGVRFLKAENVTWTGVSTSPENFISEETHRLLRRSALRQRDVLVVIAGATTGKTTVMPSELIPANTNQAVSFVRLRNVDYAEIVSAAIGSSRIQRDILLTSVQSAQPNLSMEDLGNLMLPFPRTDEIGQVLDQVAAISITTSNLIAASNTSIDRLKEYRSALITAAVTGQIDVTTYAKSGATDPKLDAIQEEMGA